METNPTPAPAPEIKKPAGRWQDGKHPLNVRPRGAQIKYIEDLIREKGSAQGALSECIDRAMGCDEVGIDRARVQLLTENKNLKAELAALKTAAPFRPAPAVPDALRDKLDKVMKARKLPEAEAIAYCIKYTAKNDWI